MTYWSISSYRIRYLFAIYSHTTLPVINLEWILIFNRILSLLSQNWGSFWLDVSLNVLTQFFLYPIEEFLSMTSNLSTCSCSYMLFYLFPVFAKQTHRYNIIWNLSRKNKSLLTFNEFLMFLSSPSTRSLAIELRRWSMQEISIHLKLLGGKVLAKIELLPSCSSFI